jgi:hypothetical protein
MYLISKGLKGILQKVCNNRQEYEEIHENSKNQNFLETETLQYKWKTPLIGSLVDWILIRKEL